VETFTPNCYLEFDASKDLRGEGFDTFTL